MWHGSLLDANGIKTVQQADIACHGQKFFDQGWIKVHEDKDDPKIKVCECAALPTEPCCPDDILDGELRGRLVNSQAGAICANRTGSDGKKGELVGEKKLCCCSVGPNGETRTNSGQCPRVGQPAQQQQQQSSGNSTAAASDLQQKKDDKKDEKKDEKKDSKKKDKDDDEKNTDLQQKKSNKKDKKNDDDQVEKEDKEDKKSKKSKKNEDSEDLERDVDVISELRTDVKNLVEEVA